LYSRLPITRALIPISAKLITTNGSQPLRKALNNLDIRMENEERVTVTAIAVVNLPSTV